MAHYIKNKMKNIFEELYRQTELIDDTLKVWNYKVDTNNCENLLFVEASLYALQELFMNDCIESYLVFEKSILTDIAILKERYNSESYLEIINYLQLSIFSRSIKYYNSLGLFSYSFDSAILSVNDYKIKNEGDLIIEHDRFLQFLYSNNPYIKNNSGKLTIEWLTSIYYCSYSSGSFVKFCFDFWDDALNFGMNSGIFSITKLRLLSSLITWSGNYKRNEKLNFNIFLLNEYEKLDWKNDLKIDVCMQLILLPEIPKNQRKGYFEELIKKVQLLDHIKLHLLVNLTENLIDLKTNFNLILEAAKEYNTYKKKELNSEVLLTFERARIFKILNPLLILLGKTGETKKLIKILGCYYDVKGNLDNSILFIFPNFVEGILYSYNKKVKLINQNTNILLKELIYIYNQLFSRTIAFIGDENDVLLPSRDFGIPSPNFSNKFEQKCLEIYNLNTFKEIYFGKFNGILHLGLNTIPIQTLMLKHVGFTYPIVSSFNKTLKDNKIKNVLIWTSGSYTSYFEQLSLIYICVKHNINFSTFSEDQISKELFLNLYSSDQYSIIWIASHGEHKSSEPHKSIINISSKETVTIEELISNKPKSQSNRLLFLNLCESGINSETGGFRGVGFGHQLVSNQQSIISHLWMVEPKVAMTFGILVAIGLFANDKNYFDAYSFATLILLSGKDNIMLELRKEISELSDVLERIENTENIDWNNILNWGSAVYYK